MDLKNNIDNQRKYLEDNLEQLNTVISAVIGIKTNLRIDEKTNYRKETYFQIVDDRNIREQCGAMAAAFKEVTISGQVFWFEEGVHIVFQFNYQHIDYGSNGAEFCRVNIVDNLVNIKQYN